MHSNVNVMNATDLCTPNGRDVKFCVVCILPQVKNFKSV